MRQFFLFISLAMCCAWSCGGSPLSAPMPVSATPPSNAAPVAPMPPNVHFFAFGDWGTGDANQSAVASQTSATCQTQRCDFGLFLGDNFYDTGVTSVDDPQWQTKYRDVYGPLQIPLYAVMGNHDWDPPANPQAEVDFDLQDKDPFWQMPAFDYSFRYPQQGDPLIEIFVINSNNFATNTAAQAWLGQAVDLSQAPWKIVSFHHPIFTNGPHPPDEKGIYPSLMPLICGKVQLLLSGHNHLFSHMKDNLDSCGYDQFVIGTGGKTLYDPTPATNVVYTEKNFGLGFFEVSQSQMTIHFIRSQGDQGYSFQYSK